MSVYLSEIATPGKKGFYVSWQSGSQQVAVIFVALLGVSLGRWLARPQMDAWGWRVPFLRRVCNPPLAPFAPALVAGDRGFCRARDPPERRGRSCDRWSRTAASSCRDADGHDDDRQLLHDHRLHADLRQGGLGLGGTESLVVTLCVGLSNLVWLPVMGALSDRVGRRPLLVAFTVLTLATAYPAMIWLTAAPTFGRLLAVELWLSFLFGSYNGAMVVALTEIMPAEVRIAGFSLAYSLATAFFGGFTPAISTFLIHTTGIRDARRVALLRCRVRPHRRIRCTPREDGLAGMTTGGYANRKSSDAWVSPRSYQGIPSTIPMHQSSVP